jgi:hypothetical protein
VRDFDSYTMCRLPFFIATVLIFAVTLMAQEKPPGEAPGAPPEKKEEKETEKEQPPKESKGRDHWWERR